MSNKVRNVTKQLLGAEDVAFGRGIVNQTRGGAVVPVHRLDLELPVVDEAELATTDTAKYPRASIGSRSFVAVNGQYQELSHILPVLYRVGGMISAEYPYCINDDVIAKWTGAFPKTLTVEDADFSGAGWQIYTVGSSRTIVSETQPTLSYGKQGFRWYNPNVPATYIYYNDGDSGQWVEEASQGTDGALRSDLASPSSAVPIAGVPAKDLFNFPKASALGVRTSNSDATNGSIFQNAINTYGGIELDLDFSFSLASGLLLPSGGAKIYSQKKQRTVTWTGSDSVWAVSTSLTGGSYQNHFENWTLTGTSTKKLFDAVRIRESRFVKFNMIGGLINCRIRSSWYTKWVNCRFANGASVANSKGLYFEFNGAEPFNVVNLADFENCEFDSNYDGIVLETGGEGIVFRNCGIEVNKRGIVVQGQGGGRSIRFCDGCYVEGNELGNIVWNKTGAGEFQNITFEDNYFATASTARAGIIEFVASNGGNHGLTFRRNKMRDFAGVPSQNVLLDVNGATMAGIYVEWFNNGEGANVPAFNRTAVNWRYMKTDVVVKLAYLTNPTTSTLFEPAYLKGEIYVSVPEFGQAVVWGTFKSVGNSFVGPLNVTEAMPITLHPNALEKCIGATITDANAESTAVTVMINGGQIRTTNLAAKVVSFSHRYSLEVDKRAVI